MDKKILVGAWCSIRWNDSGKVSRNRYYFSFLDYPNDYDFDEEVFYNTTEKELKQFLKSKKYVDEFKVISIDEYCYTSDTEVLKFLPPQK